MCQISSHMKLFWFCQEILANKVLVFLWFDLGYCEKYEAQLCTIVPLNINSKRMKSQILAVLGFWFCQKLKKKFLPIKLW